jgi:starch phosphorylase
MQEDCKTMSNVTNMKQDVLVLNLEQEMEDTAKRLCGKTVAQCSDRELYFVLLSLTKKLLAVTERNNGEKMVYYISAEFLIGKLLSNNLINLRIYDRVREILDKNGKSLAAIEEYEPEPSLGNGGLGRLAACFLDSIATLGLPGEGIGLNYHYGLFRQKFVDNLQVAEKDPWLDRQSWETPTDITFDVYFGDRKVTSRLYDIDVVGYDSGVNKLRLFDIETVDDSIVKDGINFDQDDIEKNLTLFLYPDDSTEKGRLLRIYQQYFMVSNAAQLILHEMKERQYDLRKLYDHAVIQINDTHPTMIIPELIRILVEEKAFTMDEAIEVVSKTCAYTNHTILAEALETWPLEYLEKVVPQLVPYIKELDRRVREKFDDESVYIIDKQNKVHMAFIDIHYGFSVNGVAAIHTQILEQTELNNFYKLYPGKFNNKTNGITFRRWLLCCNRELADFISSKIGDGYKKDADRLEGLLEYRDDEETLEKLGEIKQHRKNELTDYIARHEEVNLDPNGIFDIQVKRLHEYKRQQMNALYIIHKYLEIKRGIVPKRPINFIFGAKAAPAYIIAQDIIHVIKCLQEIIDNDPDVSKYIHLVMVTNYNVTYAEKLIPAADVSEQISLASKEASGTSNMKFMLNGAVTLGTSDGANVEIHDLVGDDNIYMFGIDSETVINHYKNHDYVSRDYYEKSPVIREAVDFLVGPEMMKVGRKENLERLYNDILNKDWFMALIDLEDYIRVKDKMFADYEDRRRWEQMCLTNIAKSGFFSSDRTIREYNRDIWHLDNSPAPYVK